MAAPHAENKRRMRSGELYHAFTPEMQAERDACRAAVRAFNAAASRATPRREMVRLWRALVRDATPLPPELPDAAADEEQFRDEPLVDGPLHMDYGNVTVGKGAYVNVNSVWIDTCTITIGARTLFGPNVSLFSGGHPLDGQLRNGLKGPEFGKEIHIGQDCWLGGNVTVLPGVTIGRGSTVGAGSVVTKDVPPFQVVAGNPARIIRKIETNMDLDQVVEDREDCKRM